MENVPKKKFLSSVKGEWKNDKKPDEGTKEVLKRLN